MKALSLFCLLFVSLSAHAKTVTIEHVAGTTVIETKPQRVVVIGAGALDMLDYFGITPVAVNNDYQPDYLKKYTEGDYPSAGTLFEPSYEDIYTQKPDLIITGPRMAGNYQKLSEIAPMVVLSPHATDGYWESTQEQWRIIGRIFEVSEKVEETISRIDKDFKAIKAFNAQHPAKSLTVMNFGGNVTAFSEKSRFSSLYHDFGFQQTDAQKMKTNGHGDLVSFEFIREVNPDYLFIIDGEKLRDAKSEQTREMFDNELVKQTIAFQKDQIVYLSLNAWYISMGGVRATEIMVQDLKTLLGI